MTKCTKTLYQTDTIRPAVEYSPGVGVSLLYSRRSLHKADSMDRSFVSWDSGSARSAAVEPQKSLLFRQQLSHQMMMRMISTGVWLFRSLQRSH